MRRVWLVLALTLAISATAHAAVTQPPEPVDPTPVDGDTYYLIDQASGKQASDGLTVADRSFSALGQRWAMTRAPDGGWRLSNVGTTQCLTPAATLTRCDAADSGQEWTLGYVTNGYSHIT